MRRLPRTQTNGGKWRWEGGGRRPCRKNGKEKGGGGGEKRKRIYSDVGGGGGAGGRLAIVRAGFCKLSAEEEEEEEKVEAKAHVDFDMENDPLLLPLCAPSFSFQSFVCPV